MIIAHCRKAMYQVLSTFPYPPYSLNLYIDILKPCGQVNVVVKSCLLRDYHVIARGVPWQWPPLALSSEGCELLPCCRSEFTEKRDGFSLSLMRFGESEKGNSFNALPQPCIHRLHHIQRPLLRLASAWPDVVAAAVCAGAVDADARGPCS